MLTFDCESKTKNAWTAHTHARAYGGSTMWMTKVVWCDSKFGIGSNEFSSSRIDGDIWQFVRFIKFTYEYKFSDFSIFLDFFKLFLQAVEICFNDGYLSHHDRGIFKLLLCCRTIHASFHLKIEFVNFFRLLFVLSLNLYFRVCAKLNKYVLCLKQTF